MTSQLSKSAYAFLLAGAALSLGACSGGSGYSSFDGVPLAQLDTASAAVDALDLSGSDTVIITRGPALAIAVENDPDNAMRFRLTGSTLKIGRDTSDRNAMRDAAIVRVTMPAPRALGMSGSGRIETAGMASDASIAMSGSGAMVIANLAADRLEIDSSGSGRISGNGTARVLDLSLSGSSDIDFSAVEAGTASVAVSGSGTVKLAARDTVAASVSGSGDVRVTGTATCSVTASGSGTVTCPNATATATTSTTTG